MPSFKPKVNKKISVDSKDIMTLDKKHREICESFQQENSCEIPDLHSKMRSLKLRLKRKISVEERLDVEDKLKSYKSKIKLKKQNQKDYYLKNGQYMFDYFEGKKNINTNEGKTTILHSFFKIENDTQDTKKEQSVVSSYLSSVDERFIDVNNFIVSEDICRFCNQGEMIPVDDEGILVCNKCSRQIPFLIENDKPSYKEPPKEVCFYAYKRINHFREILAQFQAKESTQIPDKVIQDIKDQIKKERIDLKQITNVKAKEILKKLGHNKYYEHIPFIKDMIGIKPPVMSPELEDTLCNLFMEIQAPYAKFCPDDRVNFLNYYYTVYKLCELLDQVQFLPYFPMLKDREKRIEQDVIWKQICDELDWEFIPTI